jgi:fructose-bisphosphate aldolase, class I
MKSKINLNRLLKKGRALFLAYDQGLEHGPTDFNDKNVDPNYIIDIAKKGKYTGIIFQKGIAEKYNNEIKKSKIPLIIKLNGKTGLVKGEPISEPLCTVEEAVKLGAKAVGYTIYFGSENESKMLSEFENIEREAHSKGLPVIVWAYPRGKGTEGKSSSELMAYATRASLEIGADIVKIVYNGNPSALEWAVKSAGKTKVVIAGGAKESEKELLFEIKNIIKSGAIGLAVGRNIWQNDKPLELTKKIKKVIWK